MSDIDESQQGDQQSDFPTIDYNARQKEDDRKYALSEP